MFVIHPEDKTTAFLRRIYVGLSNVVVDNRCNISSNEMSRMLNALPGSETVMILGHGCSHGLFSRSNEQEWFTRLHVSHGHAYYLRQHRVIGVWCHARDFAINHGLHGLFTGMFISEIDEAYAYGIETTTEELAAENELFAMRLRLLMDSNTPMSMMPQQLRAMIKNPSPLTEFNYDSIVYL